MINISFLALTRILADNNHRYITEWSDAKEKDVLELRVAKSYPDLGRELIFVDGRIKIKNKPELNSRPICRYDVKENAVIACCIQIYILINKALRKSSSKNVSQKTQEPEPVSNLDFGGNGDGISNLSVEKQQQDVSTDGQKGSSDSEKQHNPCFGGKLIVSHLH